MDFGPRDFDRRDYPLEFGLKIVCCFKIDTGSTLLLCFIGALTGAVKCSRG